jgi:hypothetical protein
MTQHRVALEALGHHHLAVYACILCDLDSRNNRGITSALSSQVKIIFVTCIVGAVRVLKTMSTPAR